MTPTQNAAQTQAWVQALQKYRQPDPKRTAWVLVNTLVPVIALWVLAWAALSVSHLLSFAIAILIGFFLMRVFCIQHDCGHGSLFKSKRANDICGRAVSLFTITPYAVWRKMHAVHHATHGDLDHREMGDVRTLTIKEYRARTPLGRFGYRVYRNPFFLFVLAPFFLFFIQYRLPVGLWHDRRYWVSAMSLNAVLACVLGAMYYAAGWAPILLIFLPSTLLGALAGVWTFYVQHQFEDTSWDRNEQWQVHHHAFYGSSHYILPAWLAWFTANIGIHHVHHLYARIPFYRLPEVLENEPDMRGAHTLTFRSSLKCIWMQLWDEDQRRMVSFADERAMRAGAAVLTPAE